MNYQSCPHWREDCSNNSVSVFWNTVSKRFAEDACGVVHVVLNGSISNTFDEKSTFGRVEVFNLHPEKVHTLKAWVMHNIESVPSDSCSSSSVNNLKQILKTRNIIFICQNNYRPVRLLQCVKNPEHSSCKYNLWANQRGRFGSLSLVYISMRDSGDMLLGSWGLGGHLLSSCQH